MLNELQPDQIEVKELTECQHFSKKLQSNRFGGYSVYGYSWLYEQAELIVTGVVTHDNEPERLSQFDFANLLKDKSLCICSVSEFRDPDALSRRSKYKLIVALDRKIFGSLLLVVDVRLHRILRCIECPFKISCIEPISSGEFQTDQLPFAEELQMSSGLVVLGTQNGTVTLLDLRLDGNESPADLLAPNKVTFINRNMVDVETKRKFAQVNEQHIAFTLNSDSHCKGEFMYQESNGEYDALPLDQVSITALKYFRQTNTLYIGFSFGGFQGWNLETLNLVFGGALESYLEPVVGFALQEPENDPRNYCYLWVLRGSTSESSTEEQEPIYSNISLFVFEYETREWLFSYGNLYRNLLSEGIRFEYFMTSSPHSSSSPDEGGGSSIIHYGTIFRGSMAACRSSEEEVSSVDSSLFYFIWEAFDSQYENLVRYLAVFDLNQWYQAQMPNVLQVPTGSSFCPFMSFYRLNELSRLVDDASGERPFLDVNFCTSSVQRYDSKECYQNDIVYYPASLSFDVDFLSKDKSVRVSFNGLQRKCLTQLRTDGQNILQEPDEFLSQCFFSGILPSEFASSLNTPELRRSAVLSMALENDELPFLQQTIENWASMEVDAIGCTCKFFLDWLWERVINIKESIDELIVPFFDESCEMFDSEHVEALRARRVTLKSLQVLLKTLTTCGIPNTERGERELFLRLEIIQFIIDYVGVVCWFYYASLIRPASYNIDWARIYKQLQDKYTSKRRAIKASDNNINLDEALLIDGLVKHCKPVQDLWIEHGSTGMYPPPNFHSMISIYLLDSVSYELKNQLMYYHLYDLMEQLALQNIEIRDRVLDFTRYLRMKPSLTKLVDALYALDHDSNDLAATILQSPNMQLSFANEVDEYKSIGNELQIRIVRTFLTKGYTLNAFRFMRSSLFVCDSLMKEKLFIKTLMRSKNIAEAYRFQKERRTQQNGDQILFQFYFDCEELNLFDKLFMFKLDQIEEEALICYLLDVSGSMKAQFLLVIYFIFNGKLFDAAKILQSVESEFNSIKDEQLYLKSMELRALVDAYIAASPPQLVKIGEIIDSISSGITNNTAATRGSVFNKTPEIISNVKKDSINRTPISAFVKTLLNKIEVIEQHEQKSVPLTPFSKSIEKRGLLVAQNSPFLRKKSRSVYPSDRGNALRNSKFVEYSSNVPQTDTTNQDRTQFSQHDMEITLNCSLNSSMRSNMPTNLLSILHTPNIKKENKPMTRIRDSKKKQSCNTPTSILKVKSSKYEPSFDNELRFDSFEENKEQPRETRTSKATSSKSEKSKNSGFHFDEKNDYIINEKTSGKDKEEEQKDVNMSNEPEIEEFTFSKSEEIKMSLGTPEEPTDLTPSKIDYVFSPPLTRSRKKKTTSLSQVTEEPLPSLDVSMEQIPQSEDKKSTKKTPRRSLKSKTDTPSHKMNLRVSSEKK